MTNLEELEIYIRDEINSNLELLKDKYLFGRDAVLGQMIAYKDCLHKINEIKENK